MTRDPGLQPERTTRAWRRTSLAMVVNGVLVLRSGMQSNNWMLLTLGVPVTHFNELDAHCRSARAAKSQSFLLHLTLASWRSQLRASF
jgi:uncharacterized membrane protein YidH (DUF202 family)